jgi:hypothetical protein
VPARRGPADVTLQKMPIAEIKRVSASGSDCSYIIYYFDFATQAALWGVSLKTS